MRYLALVAVFLLSLVAGPLSARAEEVGSIAWATEELDAYYRTLFALTGQDYESPTVTIVPAGETVYTGCGAYTGERLAFYCELDAGVVLSQEFVDAMQERDDFLPLYALAHEFAHHIQALSGSAPALAPVAGDWNQVHVIENELRADCMAGAWMAHLAERNLLDASDTSAVFVFANEIGDSALSVVLYGRNTGHGSGEERVRAVFTGYESGLVGCSEITPLPRDNGEAYP